MFRLGAVRVVIATGMQSMPLGIIVSGLLTHVIDCLVYKGTLALGINAPARTSVFCGDSPFLTALMVSL